MGRYILLRQPDKVRHVRDSEIDKRARTKERGVALHLGGLFSLSSVDLN